MKHCALASALLALALLAPDTHVQLRVYGNFGFEPATVRLLVRVEPHAENRLLETVILLDGFRMSGSHEDLPGEHARISREVTYGGLEAGEYMAVASVYRPAAKDGDWQAVERFRILERGF